jgi:hypothetical protein
LPPVQQGCEFDSLNSTGNSKPQKKPVEMRFHGSPGHFELAGDFCVVTSLQEQFDDLLFSRTQANGLLFHQAPSLRRSYKHRRLKHL